LSCEGVSKKKTALDDFIAVVIIVLVVVFVAIVLMVVMDKESGMVKPAMTSLLFIALLPLPLAFITVGAVIVAIGAD